MSNLEEKLNRALNEAKEEETLNQEELDATRGGSWINLSKDRCGDTNTNCVAGCSCPIQPTQPSQDDKIVAQP